MTEDELYLMLGKRYIITPNNVLTDMYIFDAEEARDDKLIGTVVYPRKIKNVSVTLDHPLVEFPYYDNINEFLIKQYPEYFL